VGTARRLVLVGGGPAHLHVLRELARRPMPAVDAVLVVSGDSYHAPMAAGYVAGQYEAADFRFDLDALARAARARVVRAAVERIAVVEREVVTTGERIPFDVCSLDVDVEAELRAVPGLSGHALAIHPTERVLELRRRLDALPAASARPVSVVVAGAGPRGVEMALAIRHRLGVGSAHRVSLVERASEVLPDFEPSMRQLATEVLRARGIAIALGGRVATVTAEAVTLHNGATIPADLVVWTCRGAQPVLVERSGLRHDDQGRLLVDRSMRSVDGAPVWGAGEIVTIQQFPDRDRGTGYAVREAPALERSLRAALGQGRPARYRPQRGSLTVLNTGGGWALIRWKGILRHSRWAWRLKDMMDRRFMRRFRGSDETGRSAG
jgi:NADH dehydrogenase FAD-containing subunit